MCMLKTLKNSHNSTVYFLFFVCVVLTPHRLSASPPGTCVFIFVCVCFCFFSAGWNWHQAPARKWCKQHKRPLPTSQWEHISSANTYWGLPTAASNTRTLTWLHAFEQKHSICFDLGRLYPTYMSTTAASAFPGCVNLTVLWVSCVNGAID